jgi:tRNA 2-thiouridine synthesizing protein A
MDPKLRKEIAGALPERPRVDRVLDAVGFFCPVPIIKTSARVREMMRGQVLEVLSDDRVILVDMPAWCASAGHEYLGHFEEGGEIHVFLRKAGRIGGGREGGGAE